MDKKDYDSLTEGEQISLKKALKLARIAIEADKRKGLSKESVAQATQSTIKHPMPSISQENKIAYSISKPNIDEEE